MKYIIFCLFFSLIAQAGFTQKGSLTISVSNVQSAKGKIQIGVYNRKDNFPKVGKEYLVALVDAKTPYTSYTFKNIPLGDYAIAAYHDLNADNICNRNLLGIPTENYGFSNGAKPLLSAPSFKDAKVVVTQNTTAEIKLND